MKRFVCWLVFIVEEGRLVNYGVNWISLARETVIMIWKVINKRLIANINETNLKLEDYDERP